MHLGRDGSLESDSDSDLNSNPMLQTLQHRLFSRPSSASSTPPTTGTNTPTESIPSTADIADTLEGIRTRLCEAAIEERMKSRWSWFNDSFATPKNLETLTSGQIGKQVTHEFCDGSKLEVEKTDSGYFVGRVSYSDKVDHRQSWNGEFRFALFETGYCEGEHLISEGHNTPFFVDLKEKGPNCIARSHQDFVDKRAEYRNRLGVAGAFGDGRLTEHLYGNPLPPAPESSVPDSRSEDGGGTSGGLTQPC